jgi:putative methyltransferase (TIGR04325 family)
MTKLTPKKIIKSLIPPILLAVLNKVRRSPYGWKGEYSTWSEAQDNSTGYDTNTVLHAVKKSALKVKNGQAIYERDSVLYEQIHYSWPLLSYLLLCATENGNLNVVDFGGSLGSTYFQNKKFLDKIGDVDWSIIEQKNFVDTGVKYFEDNRLHFYCDLGSCMKDKKNDVLILSSVLQYIEHPYVLLDNIFVHNFKYIIIDKTPFSLSGEDTIKIQVVTPDIYEASYPSWLFSEKSLADYFTAHDYVLFESHSGEDSLHKNKNELFEYRGMIWEKI